MKEELTYTNHSFTKKKASQYIAGIEVPGDEYFVCPGCSTKKKGGLLHMSKEYVCKCGMKYSRAGNRLYVWR